MSTLELQLNLQVSPIRRHVFPTLPCGKDCAAVMAETQDLTQQLLKGAATAGKRLSAACIEELMTMLAVLCSSHNSTYSRGVSWCRDAALAEVWLYWLHFISPYSKLCCQQCCTATVFIMCGQIKTDMQCTMPEWPLQSHLQSNGAAAQSMSSVSTDDLQSFCIFTLLRHKSQTAVSEIHDWDNKRS